MTQPTVVVLDYGSGNVHSVVKAVAAAGATAVLSRDRAEVMSADGLIVPGVGAFTAVMQQLSEVRGSELIERRLIANKPVLGICVGLQVMFETGVEHGIETAGLGQWPGVVELLDAPLLPHIGWNTVRPAVGSSLFAGLENERFYFVHSYAAQEWNLTDPSSPLPAAKVSWANYGCDFIAAVENGPLSATQFHPEKSGEAGISLLRNWISTF